MSGQYPEEKSFETPDKWGDSESAMNDPVVNPTHFTDEVPMDNSLNGETVLQDPVPLDETTMPYTVATPVEPIVEEPVVSRSVAYSAPMTETTTDETPVVPPAPVSTTLFNREESQQFRARWNEIQGKFVDEPRSAVQEADTLVSEMVEKITQMFTKEHGDLESQWKAGEVVSTEDLRKALQHYRTFFNRLVV